ncbi:MAG: Putative stomatin/prohibitin-family membrane protease subunit YbbK [uncultured Sulfurovum sp.]|uniref:Stomatin/prohibitin-family membrane protease subunit YbbK n=2 Tax=uncultured Sulfurovum sp. TaxID=269237 RepID=A0A6S6TCZ2_9BACT|nr:MAG: Putative stomatin/prohibitin-family membrane protease subunit YbbK [uncultured Sulfurovum sp.]CAA6816330.1 MAG: Putative stomatin/prohibitin-family membrane protease subunit YbbK [uncultured Sulfurovum sp.]
MELNILIILAVAVIVTLYKGIKIVPQGEEWVIEKLGKFSRTLQPGLNIIVPYVDDVRQRISTRDIIMDIPQQEVITKDNAVIRTNAIAFVRVTNPKDALYGVEDFKLAIANLIMTTLRSIIGEMKLDEALSNRESIKARLKENIIDDVADWGVTVKSVEIQDINPSGSMQDSMERQAAAERERRAIETTAEGNKNAAILEAQGKLEAAKLEAEAQVALANASAQALEMIADATEGKELSAMFLLGDRYINSLENMSKSPNSKFVVYPADIQATIKGMLGNVFTK